jgi:quercetin dioxygenase-like cupin family protein
MGERQMSEDEHRTTPEEILSLAELGSELLEQARTHHSRRAARTISAGPSLRATVMALAAGTDLAEHDPPPAATLQVLTGSVRLHAGDRGWTLTDADIITIPQQRHSLTADSDTVVLLTVALG